MEDLQSLPPLDELSRIFTDFKQVLKAAGYQTPLQRVHHMISRSNIIALGQKAQSEAERVFNLLPPGHNTKLSVDLLRILTLVEQNVYLAIPVTLVQSGLRMDLMRNNEAGQVVSRHFDEETSAFEAFCEQIAKNEPSRTACPRFAHKSASAPTSFHSSLSSAVAMLKEKGGLLQQYVHSASKRQSLLRAHYKVAQKASTYYIISQGPVKGRAFPSILSKVPCLGRSRSEANISSKQWIRSTASNLIVQRAKVTPDLTPTLDVCAKVLNTTLEEGQTVAEMVCDFVPDHSHRWIFLKCQGFTFSSRKKQKIQKVERTQNINLKYLMFPVVARKSLIQKRLRWNNKLQAIASKQKLTLQSLMKTMNEYEPLDSDTEKEYRQADKSTSPCPRFNYRRESEFLAKQVTKYERLRHGSKVYREDLMSKVDYVGKFGGVTVWRQLITRFVSRFHEEETIAQFFTDKMNNEELLSIVNSFLRIIRGDFNFYYKEALRRIHAHKGVQESYFNELMMQLEPTILLATQSQEDAEVILQRFEDLREVICRDFGKNDN